MIPEKEFALRADPLPDLLKALYEFYPIGLPSLGEMYPGKRKIMEIVRGKQSILQNNDGDYQKLVREIGAVYPKQTVRMENNAGAPSLSLSIIFREDELTLERPEVIKIKIVISLLAPNYTVFFENLVLFSSQGEVPFRRYVNIISANDKRYDPAREIVIKVKALVEKYFVGFTYAPHGTLFNHKVESGVPFGIEYPNNLQYSIFDFLFDPDYHKQQVMLM